MKPLKSQNYYEILGIPRHSSQEDIRRAFEICKHTYGNDSLATYSLFSEEENKEIFSLIAQAYETLCNPNTRREYDVYLAHLEGDDARDAAEAERMVASMIGLGAGSGGGKGRSEAIAAASGNSGTPPAPESPAVQVAEADQEGGGKNDERVEKFVDSVTEFTGPVLKKIRGMRGVSVEQLAEQTKIRITYINYLEEESFEFLPAPVYVKGFVINIATILGLPAQRVAEDYMAVYRAKVKQG
jgi:flagellar biosynthesis protein FlhG